MSAPVPERDETAELYRRFAEREARGHSPLYEALARHVADDGDILGFLLTLPKAKRQPNLLLAAVRQLCGTAAGTLRQAAFGLDLQTPGDPADQPGPVADARGVAE